MLRIISILTFCYLVSSTETGGYKSCGENKECAPIFLCVDGAISRTGIHVIDIRLDNGPCGYLEKCCLVDKVSSPPPEPTEPSAEQHTEPDSQEGCGYRNEYGAGFRIIGDTDGETQFSEFPWMVALLSSNVYQCSGSVIAPTAILTGSHCVNRATPKDLVVRAGDWDLQTTSEILPFQDRYVQDIILHEKFDQGTLFNDVALLILESPLEFMENVRPVCLPDASINFDSSRCFVAGWGKNKFGLKGVFQEIMKKVDVPIVPNDQCQKNLRDTRLGVYFELDQSFICAGGEKNKDSCRGDGGSPLVCPIPGSKERYYQAGIVAWGIGCGQENVPGVYGNVAYFRPWIDEQLTQHGIDFKHFTL